MSFREELKQAKEKYKQRTHKCDIVQTTNLHTEM